MLITFHSGAIEPQFYAILLSGLGLKPTEIPNRDDQSNWAELKTIFTNTFKSKPRSEWEKIFDGTDACCTPVFEQGELERAGFDQRPAVTLRGSPGLALAAGSEKEENMAIRAAKGQGSGVPGQGWEEKGLSPGVGGEALLDQWLGWKRGKQFDVVNGGLVKKEGSKL
jgi:alpha-methylacyl-CoA racemase